MVHRNAPTWWREAGESRTKQLYQPEPNQVVYIVPTTSILERLLLIPVRDHCIIPAAMRDGKKGVLKEWLDWKPRHMQQGVLHQLVFHVLAV
jgi:hypothetical protein